MSTSLLAPVSAGGVNAGWRSTAHLHGHPRKAHLHAGSHRMLRRLHAWDDHPILHLILRRVRSWFRRG